MDGFNDVHKWYLATFLIICSTPEVDKIDSKQLCVYVMTKKGEVRLFEEYESLLDIRDEIGTKVDNRHAKCEDKVRLKHKYYRVNK